MPCRRCSSCRNFFSDLNQHRVDYCGCPWRTAAGTHETDRQANNQVRTPVPFSNKSYCFFDSGRRISYGEQKIVSEKVACASNTGGGPSDACRFSEQPGFFFMHGANCRNAETLQERSAQPTLYHRNIGNDRDAS